MQDLKKALLQGGCAVALVLGTLTTAHAQVGGSLGLGVVGKAGSGKSDFGFHGEAWIGAGGFGGYLAGGSNDGEAFGEFGAGARFMVGGNVGVGALLTFAAQDGEDSNKMFYAVKPTFEVGFGGLTFTTTMQIPVGKKERSANNGYGNVELRDKPATTTCSNPANPNARVCDLYLVGRENGKEENRFGVDLNAAYRLDLGGFYVTPQIGVGVYDRAQGKNLVRFHAGAVAGLGFGGGLAFEGGIHVKHDNKSTSADRDGRTQAVFSAGLTWHFGGQGTNPANDFVNRSFNRTPFNKGVVSSTSLGKSFEERARLTNSNSGVVVDTVQFMDSTQANPHTRMANLPSNHVLVILGGADIAFGTNTANITNSNTYFIGGGSQVHITGINGHTGTWLTPGTRPTITAGNVMDRAIFVNGAKNVMLKGFDMAGNIATTERLVELNNADDGVIDDLSLRSASLRLLEVRNTSHNTHISNLRGANIAALQIAVEINGSTHVVVDNLTLTEMGAGSAGVGFLAGSDQGVLRNFSISDDNNDYLAGVGVVNSDHVTVEKGHIDGTSVGLVVQGNTSNDAVIRDIKMTEIANIGLIINQADNVQVTNVDISAVAAGGVAGVVVMNDAVGTRIGNVHVNNFMTGYSLSGANTTIIDLGGNTFTANGMQSACDGMNDISAMSGPLNVTTTNTGASTACR